MPPSPGYSSCPRCNATIVYGLPSCPVCGAAFGYRWRLTSRNIVLRTGLVALVLGSAIVIRTRFGPQDLLSRARSVRAGMTKEEAMRTMSGTPVCEAYKPMRLRTGLAPEACYWQADDHQVQIGFWDDLTQEVSVRAMRGLDAGIWHTLSDGSGRP